MELSQSWVVTAIPANSMAEGSTPREVKRASQTDANQSPFACKRYASTAGASIGSA
jgi:hypothetical protein